MDAETAAVLRRHPDHVVRLAGLSAFEIADEAPRPDPETVRRVVRGFELHVPLAGIVDRTQEADRVARELARLTKQRTGLQARLANPAFLERADPEVVRDTRDQEAEVGRRQEKLERILAEAHVMTAAAFAPLDPGDYRDLVRRALAEDLQGGDVTSEATVVPGQRARGELCAKQECVLAGIEVAAEVFRQRDPEIVVNRRRRDGEAWRRR